MVVWRRTSGLVVSVIGTRGDEFSTGTPREHIPREGRTLPGSIQHNEVFVPNPCPNSGRNQSV